MGKSNKLHWKKWIKIKTKSNHSADRPWLWIWLWLRLLLLVLSSSALPSVVTWCAALCCPERPVPSSLCMSSSFFFVLRIWEVLPSQESLLDTRSISISCDCFFRRILLATRTLFLVANGFCEVRQKTDNSQRQVRQESEIGNRYLIWAAAGVNIWFTVLFRRIYTWSSSVTVFRWFLTNIRGDQTGSDRC